MDSILMIHVVVLLAASGEVAAQERAAGVPAKVSNGVFVYYRSGKDLCASDDLTLLPARLEAPLDGVRGGRRRRLEEFLAIVHDEAGKALQASAGAKTGKGREFDLEVRLVEFRESNRALNIASTLAGGGAVDPGKYRIELALLERGERTEIARAVIDSTPSVRGLLMGNAFSRQSAIRKNIRGQLKKLEAYWEKRRERCQGEVSR